MFRWILICSLIGSLTSTFAQSSKKDKVDSVRLIIALNAANDNIENSKGYWEARAGLDVLMDLYGFDGGKHVDKTIRMGYDSDEDAWVANVPKGLYDLRVESLGFTNIKYPFNLEKDHREEFMLKVDSTAYSYKNRIRYNYVVGTLNFNETILVKFISGDPADNMAFLQTALAIEGMEHLNVLRSQKVKGSNSFLVTLDIADRTALNIILYRKVTNAPEIERGLIIGPDVTQAIELFQQNSNVEYANPSFLNDPNEVFLPSADYTQSEELERKLLRLMEEDPKTLDKINYIIKKTTPPKKEESNIE